jgi:hypothetical protein
MFIVVLLAGLLIYLGKVLTLRMLISMMLLDVIIVVVLEEVGQPSLKEKTSLFLHLINLIYVKKTRELNFLSFFFFI